MGEESGAGGEGDGAEMGRASEAILREQAFVPNMTQAAETESSGGPEPLHSAREQKREGGLEEVTHILSFGE